MIRDPSSARRSSRRASRFRGAAFSWPEALLPWAVAESMCDEAGRYLGVDIPRRRARWLTAKAEICFQGNARFRKQMRSAGEAGLGYLRMYMRHWLAALLAVERPDLYQKLPTSFALGHRLPEVAPTSSPRASLYRARRWNPSRVLTHRLWRFLDDSVPAPVAPPCPARPPATPLPYAALHEYPIC